MIISDNGIKALIKSEDYREDAYPDSAGYLTIGIGHKLTQSELSSGKIVIGMQEVVWRDGLIGSQVYDLLTQDSERFEYVVDKHTNVKLNQNQFDALVNFCFNIGRGAYRRSTLLRLLNKGQYGEVPTQIRRWKYAKGKVSQGLINRRRREVRLWLKPV